MKQSKYIYFREKNGKVICYNTIHNTIIAVSSNVCNDFKTKS
jgi:hypothetical protein